MEGEHLLDYEGYYMVYVNHVDNLTLRGEKGHFNTRVIIRCTINTRRLVFIDGSIINIYGVTFAGCGYEGPSVDGNPNQYAITITNIMNIHIDSCIFHDNQGGGLKVSGNCNSVIIVANCIFTNNTINNTNGGGLYIGSDTDTHKDITITNSTFTNNIVIGRKFIGTGGGGVYIFLGSHAHNNIIIVNSAFTNNTVVHVSGSGGGLLLDFDHSGPLPLACLDITNSTFANNTAPREGGGVIITIKTNLIISSSIFTNNGGGYGLLAGSDNIIITNSVFNNNGNGLMVGESIHSITITNSTFTNNGDVGLYVISAQISTMTIASSVFSTNNGDGGGLSIYVPVILRWSLEIVNSQIMDWECRYFMVITGSL